MIPGQTVIYAGNPGDLATAADVIEQYLNAEAHNPHSEGFEIQRAIELRGLVDRLRAAE